MSQGILSSPCFHSLCKANHKISYNATLSLGLSNKGELWGRERRVKFFKYQFVVQLLIPSSPYWSVMRVHTRFDPHRLVVSVTIIFFALYMIPASVGVKRKAGKEGNSARSSNLFLVSKTSRNSQDCWVAFKVKAIHSSLPSFYGLSKRPDKATQHYVVMDSLLPTE
jgi:hypothetical protein